MKHMRHCRLATYPLAFGTLFVRSFFLSFFFSMDKTGVEIYLYREQSCTKIFAKDCTKKKQERK